MRSDAAPGTPDRDYRAVFELAASGIVLLDEHLNCSDANAAFCELAAMSKADLVGRNLASFVYDLDANVRTEMDSTLRATGRWNGALRVLRGNGREAEVDWRIVGSASGARVAVATDITEQRGAERQRESLLTGERAARQEAERLNRGKDEFLATLSHELRNPLNAILGWVSVLQRTPGTNAEILQGLEVIERNARLQTHLIADLIDFAGVRFGNMSIDKVATYPAVVLQAAHAAVASLARAKKIELEWRVADRDARVMGDAARLQQIIRILVTNAIKFTPGGGKVTVEARVIGAEYEVAATDTGRGISPQFLPSSSSA